MPGDYQLLKNALDFETAASWLAEDAKDDFFPDALRFRDITSAASEYIAGRQHRLLQLDVLPFWPEHVPKKSAMLRDAVVLHPVHRVVYLAILGYFVRKLDARLLPEAYSYRIDPADSDSAYPFARRADRWKRFHNDVRSAMLDSDVGAVLLTDLASFYDHISCNQLIFRIRGLLGSSIDEVDESVLHLLDRLVHTWCHDSHGIPQNYDPSSFFGSLYLHPVDYEMVANHHRYFRWVDDIRIVAKGRREALAALHDLQRALAKHRLFLATEKTKIVLKGELAFDALLDVEDDQLLSRSEELVRLGDCARIRKATDELFERLDFHATEAGDERKFRAFTNRLLDAGDYEDIGAGIHERLKGIVLPRLETYPERTDYWIKCLAVAPGQDVHDALIKLLVERSRSL